MRGVRAWVSRNYAHTRTSEMTWRSTSSASCRSYNNNEDTWEIPSLRSELRRLFKLVHPDFFYSYPHAQAVNQDSFQLLQEYLSAAKGYSSPQQNSYQFVFYLKSKETKLEKVEIELPRPQIRYVTPNQAEILPSTREALGNLLFACGLSKHVKGGLFSDAEEIRLSELFSQASEIQRQNEATLLGSEQKIVCVKNALCAGRGIRVSFTPATKSLTLNEQYTLLRRLGKAFDLCKGKNFLGHSVLISNSYGIDELGNLWLNYEDMEEKWSTVLAAFDLEKAMNFKKKAAARKALEFKVAKLMEIEMIFTHDSLSIHPHYSQFLNDIAEGALEHGAVGGGKFHELPVKVIGNPEELADTDKVFSPLSFEVDHAFGYVAVPVWENLTNVYNFIEQHGEEALSSRKKFKQLEEQLEAMKVKARKSLKLRHLSFDKNLPRYKCEIACSRMLRNAPELSKYMEGLSVCISHEHQLPQSGCKSPLLLRWDFSISNL